MGLFAPPSLPFTRIFVPETIVQDAFLPAPDVLVATFAANARFLVTRMTAVVYSSQTLFDPSISGGPTLRLFFGPTGTTPIFSCFPNMVMSGNANSPNDVDVQVGSGSHRIATNPLAFSLVVRCTIGSTRYDDYRCGFIIEGYNPP